MNNNLFTGSGSLTRFILKRDRIRLLIWIIGLSAFFIALVPIFKMLLTTSEERMVTAEMMLNPAMVAMVGPVYGIADYNTGALYGNMMLLFSVMIVAVMNIFMITRHTRQDEELGRLEVIRSLPVGRFSNLVSAITAALIANVLLTLVSGLGLYAVRADGMDFSGCMLFGAALGVIGFFFAACTALFCQITANNRTALGLSFMLLMVLYLLRAVGDVGTNALSLISPLGLILRTENFVNNYWWPVWIIIAISIIITIAALSLTGLRDLGSGLVSERPGKRHASPLLSSSYGLAFRLLKTSIIVWVITIFIFAAMYGSVFGELENFIGNNDKLKAIFTNSSFSLTEQFIGLLLLIMSMLSTIPVLSFIQRIWGEEKSGRIEQIYGKAISRNEQFLAFFIPAFLTTIVLQLLTALGLWSVGSIVLDTVPSLSTFLQAAIVYLPAIWVMFGISIALIAYFPYKSYFSYIYLGYSLFSTYMGTIAGLPEWLKKLTPFGYIPQLPVEEVKVLNLVVLVVIFVVLGVVGFYGYGKRDMQTQ